MTNIAKSSPVVGLRMSTVHDSVPSTPDFGSLRENIASTSGVSPSGPSKTPSASQRYSTTLAKAETAPGTGTARPSGGIGTVKGAPGVRARLSSFSFSQARSWARMSIDRFLASAPRPRGVCSPFTQTSKGWARPLSMWPTKTAKRLSGASIM